MIQRVTLFLLLTLCPLLGLADSSKITANAPVTNFKLSILNDEGLRSSLLRGTEARYINDTQIDLVEMQYTIFSPANPTKVETTLLAPSASVFIVNKAVKVHGDEGVRFIRDDLDVSGENWTYEHPKKNDPAPRKLSIEKNVRVTFRAQMSDILK
jgi:hypothetical protein